MILLIIYYYLLERELMPWHFDVQIVVKQLCICFFSYTLLSLNTGCLSYKYVFCLSSHCPYPILHCDG